MSGTIYPSFLQLAQPQAHVLVVDDLSPDGTGPMQINWQNTIDGYMSSAKAAGPPDAYLHGFQWALEHQYNSYLRMDADFSHQPKYLPHF